MKQRRESDVDIKSLVKKIYSEEIVSEAAENNELPGDTKFVYDGTNKDILEELLNSKC